MGYQAKIDKPLGKPPVFNSAVVKVSEQYRPIEKIAFDKSMGYYAGPVPAKGKSFDDETSSFFLSDEESFAFFDLQDQKEWDDEFEQLYKQKPKDILGEVTGHD